jgi:hypothetical protein
VLKKLPRGLPRGTAPNFEKNVDYSTVAGGAIYDINRNSPYITHSIESGDPVEIAIRTILEHGPNDVAREMHRRYAGANHGVAALIRLADQLGQLPRNMADDLLKWADANITERIGPKITRSLSEQENMRIQAALKKAGGE